jgi:hypothetical protein
MGEQLQDAGADLAEVEAVDPEESRAAARNIHVAMNERSGTGGCRGAPAGTGAPPVGEAGG